MSSIDGETTVHPGFKYETPAFEAHKSAVSLKARIQQHYDVASDYYYSLWGQHIHHGFFQNPEESKEEAQTNLIKYLLELSGLPRGSEVLDVGCGIGGTSRYLAAEHGCHVTGITISDRQVEIAKRLTLAEAPATKDRDGGAVNVIPFPPGDVQFIKLDAEDMLKHFTVPSTMEGSKVGLTSEEKAKTGFDCVWVSEALSHFPNKPDFFSSSSALLSKGRGRLVIADWFKAPNLSPEQEAADIKPIEDGMLLPPLSTADEYVAMAKTAGLELSQGPVDISGAVAKTWDISWSLVSSPALWAFAISQGRDGLAFLQAFRAMRRGYANGTFRYAVMAFEKP